MTPTEPGGAVGLWQRFAAAHLFDYNAAATRLWLLIMLAGACALAWVVAALLPLGLAQLWPVAAGVALVMLAGLFPVHIPRTSYSLGIADIFVFTLLLTLGVPAAVVAAGAEGALGAWRNSKRLTSRLSTPAANMAAMLICGLAFDALRARLAGAMNPEVADLLSLSLVALLPFVLTTLPLMSVVLLKRGQRIVLSEWFGSYSWVGAVYLGSAIAAGIVHLNAVHFGRPVIGVAAVSVLAFAGLLRVSLRRQEAEHQAQETRIAEARRQAEVSQQRFVSAFAHAGVGMAIVDPGGQVLQVNTALCSLVGRQAETLVGQPFTALLHPGDTELFARRTCAEASQQDPAFSMELRCRGGEGRQLWVALHCSRFNDAGGAGTCRIYQLHDITSRRHAESRLQHIAYHDSLTDLANRNCFQERLSGAVDRSRLDPAVRFAVLFLDLDRFKIVNDSLGHMAGNELLREVASRLRECVRPADLVARLGGDEFAILLDGLHDPGHGVRLAERVLASLMRPIAIDGTEVVPGASVGITLSDLGYRTVDEVLRDADLAMYAAKSAGRGRVVMFDHSMHERIADKLALEADLRRAIGAGQLSVAFQPLYELEPYRLSGFEALARWKHPERGWISPAVFIALAEEAGHIEALTHWVVDHAAKQLAEWHAAAPHMAHLGMHVNISGRDLAQPGLVGYVREVLLRHRLAPDRLTLEITETTLMGQLDVSMQALESLCELGIHFSIDDFGTGYSSLAYLSTLPIDSLKIDRSFVMGMSGKPENIEIVRAVLTLGRSLGKRVIAEGIETVEQLSILRELGVPCGQGYLLSRPLRADQVPALLALPAALPA
ncbi:MAG TPA: EAL domain-containing protein [Ideonella sp.]|nr:EAL domain-containing protein [Ideonella sp.]